MDRLGGNLGQGGLDPAISEVVHEPVASGKAGSGAERLVISPEALRALPADFIKRHGILPLQIDRGTIRIAAASPCDRRVVDDIRLLTGLEVEECPAPADQIKAQIAESYQVTVEQMIENLGPERAANGEGKNLHDIEVMANEPTVVNLVNVIISTAMRERASDIHLVPFENTLQLRYRD